MYPDQMLSYEFMRNHPDDAARVLERFPVEEMLLFIKDTPLPQVINVISAMDSLIGAKFLEGMQEKDSARIIERLPLKTGSLLLQRMDKPVRERILEFAPHELTAKLRSMNRYREGTAGYIMDTHVFTLPDDIIVKDALNRLRKHSGQVLEHVYVLDRKNILIGYVALHKLTTAPHQHPISSMTGEILWKLHPGMSKKVILSNHGWQYYNSLPVVDEQRIFLGALEHISLRKQESDVFSPSFSKEGADVGSALGELYWIGISAFAKGVAAVSTPQNPAFKNLKRRQSK